MKRVVLVLLILFFGLSDDNLFASNARDGDVVTIPLEEGDNEEREKNKPRNLYVPLIQCIYCNSTFILSFYETFENVTVIIENITTGEQWSKFIDYSESIVKIPTSSNNGTYHISIHTDEGVYSGVFNKSN